MRFIAFAVIIAAIFGGCLFNNFILCFDSEVYIIKNPQMIGLSSIKDIWTTIIPTERMYLPVTYTVYNLIYNFSLWHSGLLDPFWFHLVNIAVHFANVCLVYLLLKKLVRDGFGAFLGALVFAVHPFQVEPVAWCMGLRDLLAGMFSLGSMLVFVRYLETANRKLHYLCIALFFLALLSKTSAIILPLAWYAIDRINFKKEAKPKIHYEAIIFGMALLLFFTVRLYGSREVDAFDLKDFLWSPIVALNAIGIYIKKIIFLGGFYINYEEPTLYKNLAGIFNALLVIVFGVAVTLFSYKTRIFIFVVLFAVFMVPNLGNVIIPVLNESIIQDRFIYMSMFAISGITCYLAKRFNTITIFAVVIVFGLYSHVQVKHWENELSVMHHALEYRPDAFNPNLVLSVCYGRVKNRERYKEHFEKALKKRPNDATIKKLYDIEFNQGGGIDE